MRISYWSSDVCSSDLRLRLPLNKAGAWNDERLLDTASQTMPLHHVRGSAQILDTAVGTASNEDVFNSHILHPLPLGEAHIIQRFLRSGALGCVRKALRVGNRPGNRPNGRAAGRERVWQDV